MDDKQFETFNLDSYQSESSGESDSSQINESPPENDLSSNSISNEQFEINLERFIESRLVLGASPTGTKNALADESQKGEGAVSNKGK